MKKLEEFFVRRLIKKGQFYKYGLMLISKDVPKNVKCSHDFEAIPLNITVEESEEYKKVNDECDYVHIEKGQIGFKNSTGGYTSLPYGAWSMDDLVCLKCRKIDRKASDYVRNYFQRRKQAMEIVNEAG